MLTQNVHTVTGKAFDELDNSEYWEIKNDLYYMLEGYVGKVVAKSLLAVGFESAVTTFGDTKELYEYFYNLVDKEMG
jgi:hypothetical protein